MVSIVEHYLRSVIMAQYQPFHLKELICLLVFCLLFSVIGFIWKLRSGDSENLNSPNSQSSSTFITLPSCKWTRGITITTNQLESVCSGKINALNRWKTGESIFSRFSDRAKIWSLFISVPFTRYFILSVQLYKSNKSWHNNVCVSVCVQYNCAISHSQQEHSKTSTKKKKFTHTVNEEHIAYTKKPHSNEDVTPLDTSPLIDDFHCRVEGEVGPSQQGHFIVYSHLMDVGTSCGESTECMADRGIQSKHNVLYFDTVGGLLWLTDFYVILLITRTNTH